MTIGEGSSSHHLLGWGGRLSKKGKSSILSLKSDLGRSRSPLLGTSEILPGSYPTSVKDLWILLQRDVVCGIASLKKSELFASKGRTYRRRTDCTARKRLPGR